MKNKKRGIVEAVVNAGGVILLAIAVAISVVASDAVGESVEWDGDEWGGMAYREWCANFSVK